MSPNENLSLQPQVYIQRRDSASRKDGQRFWANITLTGFRRIPRFR